MRLCTIQSGGKAVVGVKTDNGKIIDLSKQMPRGPKSVVEILAGGKKLQQAVLKACAKPKAGATVPEKSAKYLPPVPNPGKILCIGLNYRKHAEETGSKIPDYPLVFTRFFRSRSAPNHTGNGLGLHIAQGFAEAFGGSITIISPHRDGQGTRMSIRLPLAADQLPRIGAWQ